MSQGTRTWANGKHHVLPQGTRIQAKPGGSFTLRRNVVCGASSKIFSPLPQKPKRPSPNRPCPRSVPGAEVLPRRRRLLTTCGLS